MNALGDVTHILDRVAEHELRFLSSLRLSLGAAPHTPSVDVVVDHDHPLSQPAVDSSVFRASNRNAMAVERYDITRQFTRSDHYSFVIPPRSRNVLGAPAVPAVPAASTPAPLARLHIAETPAAHSVLLHADSQQQRPETSSFTYGTHISNATRLHSTSGYQCCWEGDNYQQCGVWVEGGIKEVWKHVQKAHGLRGLYSGSCHCKWGGCEEKLKQDTTVFESISSSARAVMALLSRDILIDPTSLCSIYQAIVRVPDPKWLTILLPSFMTRPSTWSHSSIPSRSYSLI
ncbi:hypothetical protein HYDPIDRAFT_109980 [Hydnomerulius pinastri MD-312]|nr:hypothetical protein HYDPIDRAFT_109980 [Hydnomerulius pinastri MD-312]